MVKFVTKKIFVNGVVVYDAVSGEKIGSFGKEVSLGNGIFYVMYDEYGNILRAVLSRRTSFQNEVNKKIIQALEKRNEEEA